MSVCGRFSRKPWGGSWMVAADTAATEARRQRSEASCMVVIPFFLLFVVRGKDEGGRGWGGRKRKARESLPGEKRARSGAEGETRRGSHRAPSILPFHQDE